MYIRIVNINLVNYLGRFFIVCVSSSLLAIFFLLLSSSSPEDVTIYCQTNDLIEGYYLTLNVLLPNNNIVLGESCLSL